MEFNFDKRTQAEIANQPTLRFTKKLDVNSTDPIEQALLKGYEQTDPLSLFEVALLQAAYEQKRIYSVISRDASQELGQNCPNAKFALDKSASKRGKSFYKTLVYRITKRDRLFHLKIRGKGMAPAVYELTEPTIRAELERQGVDAAAQLKECKAFVAKKERNKRDPNDGPGTTPSSNRPADNVIFFPDWVKKKLPEVLKIKNVVLDDVKKAFAEFLKTNPPIIEREVFKAELKALITKTFNQKDPKQKFHPDSFFAKGIIQALIDMYPEYNDVESYLAQVTRKDVHKMFCETRDVVRALSRQDREKRKETDEEFSIESFSWKAVSALIDAFKSRVSKEVYDKARKDYFGMLGTDVYLYDIMPLGHKAQIYAVFYGVRRDALARYIKNAGLPANTTAESLSFGKFWNEFATKQPDQVNSVEAFLAYSNQDYIDAVNAEIEELEVA